jgi:hypothetical protein
LIKEKPLEREVFFCFGQLGDDIYVMYQVYLISSNNQQGKRYKIGYTRNDVSKRIKQLKTGNSDELILEQLYTSKWGTKIEAILHRKYSNSKISGEWFNLDQNQVEGFLIECKNLDDYYKSLIENSTFTNPKNKML